MAEGGPYHASGNEETYAERLRDTDRESHAETVESRQGVVTESIASYLAGES